MLVLNRPWWDYVSYAGRQPLFVKRVHADDAWQTVIRDALDMFENTAAQMIATYRDATDGKPISPFIDHYAEEGFTF
jgi:hypothetical protein